MCFCIFFPAFPLLIIDTLFYRLIQKVLSDFGEASLQGAKAIIDGYITPMNPNEPARSHVYLHNNIFFSRAVDTGLDTFKIHDGDGAARKTSSRDADNVGVLHRLDVQGLHTLATVLVEYLGTRIVCQSIVPGILHGEKSHSLLYGAVEMLSTLQCDEEMHSLLEKSMGEGCMVATRGIPSRPLTEERMERVKEQRTEPVLHHFAQIEEEKGENDQDKIIRMCGPIEMKGILGSDKRKYVLDCTRLTPRDANWINKASGGTGAWEGNTGDNAQASRFIPTSLDDDEWTACILRQELVTAYAEMKIGRYLAEHSGRLKNEAKKKEDEEDASTNGEAEEKKEEGTKVNSKKDKPSSPADLNRLSDSNDSESMKPTLNTAGKKEVAGVVNAEKKAIKATGSLAETIKKPLTKKGLEKMAEGFLRSLRYNVNVFLPHTRSIEFTDKESHNQLKLDEEEARNLARYLWDTVIPDFTREIRGSGGTGFQLPVDGQSLTELLHQRGINCRYLGRLAELAQQEERVDILAQRRAEEEKELAPRLRMPLCWLELLECEMVARAAKHVLNSYFSEEEGASYAALAPAQIIASVLSALVSVGEESAVETGLRIKEDRGGVEQGNSVITQDEINTLTLIDVGGSDSDGMESLMKRREEIWADIEREVRLLEHVV